MHAVIPHFFVVASTIIAVNPRFCNARTLHIIYYVEHGFDFIMLVTGLIHSGLNKVLRTLGKSSISKSTFDFLVKAGHMRMVFEDDERKFHNMRTRDLELIEKTGFIPQGSYPVSLTSE